MTFDLLAECKKLVHGVFLRHGGVSQGDFNSLNFGLSQGDLEEHVSENQKRALKALGLSSACSLAQEHGTRVVQAKVGLKQKGDALTTNQSGLGLSILHADCQAAIIYDPIEHALSTVHCGWRGNVQNIYKETIEAMRSLYGSKPENLLVGISPSLGPTASEFIHYKTELPTTFLPFQVEPNYFDLWAISQWQLMECGLLPHHIEIAEMCTYSNAADFFSYRRVKKSGRHASFAKLE